MTNLFLKAKHWQLFIIIIVIPIFIQFYWLSDFFWFQQQQILEPRVEGEGFTEVLNERFYQFDYLPFVMIGFSMLLFGWFWSIAIGLQKKIPLDIKMKVRKFKILFFIPVFYILFLMLFLSGIFYMYTQSFFLNDGIAVIAIILPLHLFSMFCIFYSMYFVAKTIKTAELQRETQFGDFVLEFFMLWFYFVGIWIIQPKVNKLYQKKIDRQA